MRQIIRLTALAAGLAGALYPQRIYNQAQDARATEALRSAAAVTSSRVFENALGNIAELSKRQQDDFVRDARALLSRRVAAWSTWGDLQESCEQIAGDLRLGDADSAKQNKDELDQALIGVGAKQAALNVEAKALEERIQRAGQLEGNLKFAGEWLGRVGQIAPAADLVQLLAGATPSSESVRAARSAQEALAELAELYSSFNTGIPERPSALFLQMRLDLLEAEEKTILRKLEIAARRQREVAPSQELIGHVREGLKGLAPNELIAKTLDELTAKAKANPAEAANLERALDTLHRAVALAVRGQLATDLADSRGWLEDRAQSLRQSQVVAGFYQNLLLTGAQRLSAYYKGGMRPQTIADLIQAAAAVGLIPALLTR